MSEAPQIRGPAGPLRLAGSTGGPIVLSSVRASMVGDERGGWPRALVGPTVLLEHLTASLPDPDALARTPFLSERGWSADVKARERVFLPPNVDGFVAEWALGESERPALLDLAWSVPGSLSWKLGPTRLAVRDAGGGRRLFCLEPAPEWSVTLDPSLPDGLRVKARVSLAPHRAARLVAILRTEATRRRPVLRALAYLGAEQTRAEVAIERTLTEEISLEVPDVQLDQLGFQWAHARMGSPPRTPLKPPHGSRPTAGVGAADAPAGVRALLAALGFLAVGRFEAARQVAPRASGALDGLLGDWEGSGPTHRPDPPEGIDGLLRAARSVPHELVALTRSGRATGTPRGGLDEADAYAEWLHGWRAFDRGDSEAGYAFWRTLLKRGSRGGWSWAKDGDSPADPVLAGLVPATLVFGMLGARAEAAVGRLRLAPAFPDAWRSVRIRNLRVGSSAVSVSYERKGNFHDFSLEQATGATPVNLVLEPLLQGSGVVGARVDGHPAELDEVREGRRVGIRLQLPLDRERRVEVHVRD